MGLMKGLITSFTSDGYLLMDTSYLVHTIAFRTFKIYSEHFDLPDDGKDVWQIDFSMDEDFMSIFNRNFVSTVNKFLKKYRIDKSRVVFAIDCKKTDIWRRSFFESYKFQRIQGVAEPEGLNRGPIFRYVLDNLLPKLTDGGMGVKIAYPIAEGDDIIAITKRYIRSKNAEVDIVIITSDHDFLQLFDDHTVISTIQEKLLREKSLGSPKKDLLFKILVGDGSDEIPGCFKKTPGDKELGRGFGRVTCLKFIENPELLKRKFNEYPEAVKQYKTNKIIVDFDNIPNSIQSDVITILDEVLDITEKIYESTEIEKTGIHSL